MRLKIATNAATVIGATLAAIFTPPALVTPSQWMAGNLVVPDGPRAGEKWDATLTPYVVEPVDHMGPAATTNKVVIQKSAQTGFTVAAMGVAGHGIACDPAGGILLVQPTQDALADFIRDKLNPAIEASPALKQKIRPQKSRDGEGSTTFNKRYPGGSLALAIANSTADLRSKTKRKIIKDEASEYPEDLDGQGSPHAMIEARYESFLASGEWKELNISTPTIKGGCYITEQFEAGDRRYWHVTCTGCGEPFFFQFGQDFRFNPTFPYKAHYVAPCCGTVIEAHEKVALVRGGRWIATAPGEGKFPSYHVDALSSPFVPWDKIAERWLAAQNNPAALKAFYNLTLGQAYEMRGDAPDHEKLFARREADVRRGHIPPRGLMLVGAADVQMNAIYFEIVAFAPNRESWVVDADVVEGDTSDPHGGAFAKLAEIYDREYPDAFGGRRRVDAFAVDSGFRSHVVYEFCRTRHNAFAVKGVDGWSRPALGQGSPVDVDLQNRKTGVVKVWPVGTWSLKGAWYDDVRREGRATGREVDPPGYCHFGTWLDLSYFEQVTAEYLSDERVRGRMTKAWRVRGKSANHWLDCRIYNMALADHLGLSRMTADEWAILARERAGSLADQADLFAPRPLAVLASSATRAASPYAMPAEQLLAELAARAAGQAEAAQLDQAADLAAPIADQAEAAPPAPGARQAEPRREGWIRARTDWLKRD